MLVGVAGLHKFQPSADSVDEDPHDQQHDDADQEHCLEFVPGTGRHLALVFQILFVQVPADADVAVVRPLEVASTFRLCLMGVGYFFGNRRHARQL